MAAASRWGGVEGAGVGGKVGDLQRRQAVLPAAEKVAGAAGLQVVLGHRETVGGGAEEFEPAAHRFGFVVADQKAPALGGAPAHPAPQLVQGGKAIPLGVLDDHDGGVGHVHPHLDDSGGHQRVQPPGPEILHDGGFLLGFQLAVHQAHPAVG